MPKKKSKPAYSKKKMPRQFYADDEGVRVSKADEAGCLDWKTIGDRNMFPRSHRTERLLKQGLGKHIPNSGDKGESKTNFSVSGRKPFKQRNMPKFK